MQKENLDIKITPDAIAYLITKTWPGNIRQLESYFQRKFYDAKYEGVSNISKIFLEIDPPRNYKLDENDKYASLETLLKEIIENWDYEKHGKFLDELIEPMISKVYLKDLQSKFNKSDANQILGIDGDRKNSKLEQNVHKYDETIKKLH